MPEDTPRQNDNAIYAFLGRYMLPLVLSGVGALFLVAGGFFGKLVLDMRTDVAVLKSDVQNIKDALDHAGMSLDQPSQKKPRNS